MSRRALAGLLVVALFATVALWAIGWPASAARGNDFASFWVMGRMLLDRQDMYDFDAYVAAHRAIGNPALSIVAARLPASYPLTTALLCAAFAVFPVAIAAPLWLVSQTLLAVAATVALARRIFAAATFRRDLFVLLGLAVSSQPAWLLAGGGNMGGFLLAIAASSTALLIDGRALAAGAVAGLFVIKPHVLLFAFAALALTLPRATALRFVAGAGAVAGALTLVTLVLDPRWIGELLDQLGGLSAFASRQATVFGLLGPDLAVLAWAIVGACLVAFVVWARRARPSLPVLVAAAIPLSLFCTRYGWSYDHLLLVVTAAVIVGSVADAPARSRWIVTLALTVVLVPMTWGLYGLAFQRGEESFSAFVPLAMLAVLALSLRMRAVIRPRYAGA